jgi:hypothetical protein
MPNNLCIAAFDPGSSSGAAIARRGGSRVMSDPIQNSLELVFRRGAVRVLRRRAEALHGVTVLDRTPVVVVESESAHILRMARDWDRIASELEAEGDR